MKGEPLRVPLSRKISAAAIGLRKGFVLPTSSAPNKKRSRQASFFIWCGRWDLNPHVMDTRTSNVPVCLFQHFRITLYYYTICCGFVNTVSRQILSKNYIKFRCHRGLTPWNDYEVFYPLALPRGGFPHPFNGFSP